MNFRLPIIRTRNLAFNRWIACTLALAGLPLPAPQAAPAPALAQVQCLVLDQATGQPVPARFHLEGPDTKPVKVPGLPFWKDHFVCTGSVTLTLAPGTYRCQIEHGPEFSALQTNLHVTCQSPQAFSFTLARIAHLKEEGWWSGETHVHRPVSETQLHLSAEDLHIAPVITWWNTVNPWTNALPPTQPILRTGPSSFYQVMGGEDERGGGALLFFNLAKPLPITEARREFPSSMKFLRQAHQQPGVWVDIEKPFWWDVPLWLASGLVDSIGIVHNHMHRSGVLENEAWGKARDRSRYPGPHGNGQWTQDIYYHLLNCGLRLPPSAGSASGVLPNPVGYNRAYVQMDGELTWNKWWEGLRAGRVFVSNGPLLRCQANQHWPGHVFQAKTGQTLNLELTGRLDSRDPIAHVEIIRDGRVVATPSYQEIRSTGRLGTLTFTNSGWFLARAIADITNTFRFASTGPFYVEFDGQPRVHRDSARFFLDWTRERRSRIQLEEPQRAEVFEELDRAERFWESKANVATPQTKL